MDLEKTGEGVGKTLACCWFSAIFLSGPIILAILFLNFCTYEYIEDNDSQEFRLSEDPIENLQLGIAQRNLGDFEKSKKTLLWAHYLDRENLEIRKTLAEVLALNKRPELAAIHLKEYLEIKSSDAKAWSDLAYILSDIREWDEALEAAEKAKSLSKDYEKLPTNIMKLKIDDAFRFE